MQSDTPLTEVAHHLPAATAEFLGSLDPHVQEATLISVRSFVSSIEERTQLDPFQYEVVIDIYVLVVSTQFELLRDLVLAQVDLLDKEG